MSLLGSVRDMIASASTKEGENDDDASSVFYSVANWDKETKEGETNGIGTETGAVFETETKSKTDIDTNENHDDSSKDDVEQIETESKQQQQPQRPSTSWLIERDDKNDPHPNDPEPSRTAKDWIDRWTAEGLSEHVALPMICVLGETSSGKSSVLSSLVGLELPSASTLTTKCPVLVQLRRAPEGSRRRATVRIQWHQHQQQNQQQQQHRPGPRSRKRSIETNLVRDALARIGPKVDDGRKSTIAGAATSGEDDTITAIAADDEASGDGPRDASGATSVEAPPPVWNPRLVLDDPETKLPELIRDAQDVVLRYRNALVAPDTIQVAIESPDLREELTLVDLPGLVQFQHDQDPALLGQVERVVLEYARNPRSVLLPIVAAPSNLHNSRVLQWALEFDPETTRTIPVLTKPDLVDPGSEPDVLELLRTKQQFKHGFYLVKNRGQALLDKGASIDDGLSDEAEYFQSTIPWNAVVEPRLGVPSLRTKLAAVLWDLMRDSLPEILRDIRRQSEAARTGLAALGPLYTTRSEQRRFYHSLCQDLINDVRTDLSGKGHRRRASTSPGGAARLHAACHRFCGEIRAGGLATVTELVEGDSVLVYSQAEDVRGELVYLDSARGFACCDCIDTLHHTTDLFFDGIDHAPEHGPDFRADDVWVTDDGRVCIGRAGGVYDTLRKLPLNRIQTDPTWLEDKIRDHRTDDLACFASAELFQRVVAEFVRNDWAPPCQALLESLREILESTLEDAVSRHPGLSRFPRLRNLVDGTCRRILQRLLEDAKHQVTEHLLLEEEHPYTQDDALLRAIGDARCDHLERDLELRLKLDQEGVVFDTHALRSVLDGVFRKHRRRKHWMAEQLEVSLDCYGKVAANRVLDRTPQICWRAARTLPSELLGELGGATDDTLEECLREPPAIGRKHERLKARLDRLQAAAEVVRSAATTSAR